jgi:hypothetical protein
MVSQIENEMKTKQAECADAECPYYKTRLACKDCRDKELDKAFDDPVSELAQKLYNDEHAGNLYEQDRETVTFYEEKAMEEGGR